MLRHRLTIAVLLAAGVLIGFVLVADRRPDRVDIESGAQSSAPPISSAPNQSGAAASLDVLRHRLELAEQAREQLEHRLSALQRRIEELEHARVPAPLSASPTADRRTPTDAGARIRSSVQVLIDAGISEDQAVWIQERLDEIDLQQLYLRDRAIREGWLNKPRYQNERREYLNAVDKLRPEVGDDAYDRLLYALGRTNRVVVRDTMQHSSASAYGLQAGDHIIEYDGQRVFDSSELSSLVTQGSAGVMTLVRVERGGTTHDVYLPRGPLGIRMIAERVVP